MQCAMTSLDNLSFVTNNVKGIQSIKKRLNLIGYFKSKKNGTRNIVSLGHSLQ